MCFSDLGKSKKPFSDEFLLFISSDMLMFGSPSSSQVIYYCRSDAIDLMILFLILLCRPRLLTDNDGDVFSIVG